jgi:hypothetical protein
MFEKTSNSALDFSKAITYICEDHAVGPEVFVQNRFEFPGGFNFIDSDFVVNSFYIDKVIYNDPATIVIWSDGTKTVSKTHAGDVYSPEVGLVLCVLKKLSGSTKVHDLIEAWIPDGDSGVVTVSDVRKRGRANKRG